MTYQHGRPTTRIVELDFSMNRTDNNFRGLLIALLCCAIGIVGCGEAMESLHDEHLEHFVPAHKPRNFGELVEQLALRVPQLASATSLGGDDDHARSVQEMADIIGWIPELSADSELIKADFESAVATGNKLSAVYSKSIGSTDAKAVDVAEFEPLIDELRKLVPKSKAQKERI